MNVAERILTISEEATSIEELLNAFEPLCPNPVAVIDENYRIISHRQGLHFEDATWNQAIKKGYWSGELLSKIKASLKEEEEKQVIKGLGRFDRLFVKLSFKGENLGYLVFLNAETPFGEMDSFILDNLALLVARTFYLTKPETHGLTQEAFLLNLLEGHYLSRRIYEEKKRALGLKWQDQGRLFLFDLTDYERKEGNEFKETFSSFASESTILLKEEYSIVYVPHPLNMEIQNMIDSFCRYNHVVGLASSRVYDPYGLKTIYDTMLNLLRKVLEVEHQEGLLLLEDYKLLLPLFDLKDSKDLLNYVSDEILEMESYDKQNGSEYLPTLFNYLLYDRSLEKTSSSLYVHKNTIAYRLERIKELFPIDLDDYNRSFLYLYSCYILKFLSTY